MTPYSEAVKIIMEKFAYWKNGQGLEQHRKVVELPSLEALKKCVGMALQDMV